jgi:DNA polymerase III epsilon subunit-like protein
MEFLFYMSKYVVLDLEMCNVSKKARQGAFKSGKELIQIGAVELDENYNVTRSFQSFVKPEFGALDPFIENLTGIKPENLENAPSTDRALREFYEWLDDSSTLVTWSDCDVIQIDDELYYKEIDIPGLYDYIDEYVDCQYLFGEMFHVSKQYNLKDALTIANVEYDLNLHNALVDAMNTALLFSKLQTEDRATFSPYYMTQEEASMYIFNSFSRRCLV